MPFWTAVDGKAQDPKRESRFVLSIESLNDGSNNVWYAKSFGKPKAEVTTTPHKYLNHTFNYPGSVKWSAVDLEIIDPTDPIDGAGSIAQLLEAMGYQIPKDGKDLINISKRKGVGSLGYVTVSSIDDEGNEIETWTLKQAFVSKFDWGSYKYEGDSLLSLKLTLTYDWAECQLNRSEQAEAVSSTAVQSTTADGKKFFSNT
jgi:hypothetical protein